MILKVDFYHGLNSLILLIPEGSSFVTWHLFLKILKLRVVQVLLGRVIISFLLFKSKLAIQDILLAQNIQSAQRENQWPEWWGCSLSCFCFVGEVNMQLFLASPSCVKLYGITESFDVQSLWVCGLPLLLHLNTFCTWKLKADLCFSYFPQIWLPLQCTHPLCLTF